MQNRRFWIKNNNPNASSGIDIHDIFVCDNQEWVAEIHRIADIKYMNISNDVRFSKFTIKICNDNFVKCEDINEAIDCPGFFDIKENSNPCSRMNNISTTKAWRTIQVCVQMLIATLIAYLNNTPWLLWFLTTDFGTPNKNRLAKLITTNLKCHTDYIPFHLLVLLHLFKQQKCIRDDNGTTLEALGHVNKLTYTPVLTNAMKIPNEIAKHFKGYVPMTILSTHTRESLKWLGKK